MPGRKPGNAITVVPAGTPATATPAKGEIRLDLVSMTAWRACDRRFLASDPRAVLGFVERHGSAYEVTTVNAPDRIQVFTGLASATTSFSDLK